jgi:hypothetical protein
VQGNGDAHPVVHREEPSLVGHPARTLAPLAAAPADPWSRAMVLHCLDMGSVHR